MFGDQALEPARGRAHAPSLRFGPDVSSARPLCGRLFVEADALSLVQLIETARLDRAAVEEPFLSAIVANKPETAIPYQPFDRAVRHVD
jgi:hypothetical protein